MSHQSPESQSYDAGYRDGRAQLAAENRQLKTALDEIARLKRPYTALDAVAGAGSKISIARPHL